MKYISFILAVFIGFLTVQLTVSDVYGVVFHQEKEVCVKDCCEHTQKTNDHSHKKDPKDCCSNGICNPFLQCSCCFGMILPSSINVKTFNEYKYLKIKYFNSMNSSYTFDFFNPPKSV